MVAPCSLHLPAPDGGLVLFLHRGDLGLSRASSRAGLSSCAISSISSALRALSALASWKMRSCAPLPPCGRKARRRWRTWCVVLVNFGGVSVSMARWSFLSLGKYFQPEERADRIDTKFGTFLEQPHMSPVVKGYSFCSFGPKPWLGVQVLALVQTGISFFFALVKRAGVRTMTTVSVLNLGGEDTQSARATSVVTSHHWIMKNEFAVTDAPTDASLCTGSVGRPRTVKTSTRR